jgi:hypothetical protein
MATLHIMELSSLPLDSRGNIIPIPPVPPLAEQVVTYTTSTQSTAFGTQTKFIRVIASAAAHLSFSANPTATAANMWIPASTPEFFAVTPGHEVAAYDGSS